MNILPYQKLLIGGGIGMMAFAAVSLGLNAYLAPDSQADTPPATMYLTETLADISQDDLLKDSEAVVIGTITKVHAFKAPSEIHEGNDEIYSDVTVAVEEYVVNTLGSQPTELTFRTRGGKTDKDSLTRPVLEPFEKGQRQLLFLRRHPDGHLIMVLDPFGRYTITEGTLGNSPKEARLLKTAFGAETLRVDEVKEKVKKHR
jgi:hypothetical protein